MRLGLLIGDEEYRDALVQKLSSYDNDLFVSIIGRSDGETADCMLLTDIAPETLDEATLKGLGRRTVFLTSSAADDPHKTGSGSSTGIHRVFKYSSVSALLSELSYLYSDWHGMSGRRSCKARLIAACSEYDSYSSDKCHSLAAQILYRRGGSVLLIGLGYINDYGCAAAPGINSFARLMYTIGKGREGESQSFTKTDSYGVSYLMLPEGRNPMAYLELDELRQTINGLSTGFDTIILDVGTCYRKENISIIREAESIVFFESGRRSPALQDILGREASERCLRIRITGEAGEAAEIDDCIRKIYGMDEYGNLKSRDDK